MQLQEIDELLHFLCSHAGSITYGYHGGKKNINKKVTVLASSFQPQCIYCKGSHYLSKCEPFLKLPLSKRVQFVKSNNDCFNSLAIFHQRNNCKSIIKCHKCKKRGQHTMLLFESFSDSKSIKLRKI